MAAATNDDGLEQAAELAGAFMDDAESAAEWTATQDEALLQAVLCLGEGKWEAAASLTSGEHSAAECRSRYAELRAEGRVAGAERKVDAAAVAEEKALVAPMSSTVCNACWQPIEIGAAITWCLECDNFSLCAACEATGGHPLSHDTFTETYFEGSNAERIGVDGCTCLGQVLRRCMETYSARPMLGVREQPMGRFRHCTYGQVLAASDRFRGALHSIGVAAGEMVSICAANSPEWYVADFAATLHNCIVAPTHVTLAAGDLAPVFARLEVRAVVCSEDVVDKVVEAAGASGSVRSVVVIRGANAAGLFPPCCVPEGANAHLAPAGSTPLETTTPVAVYDFGRLLEQSPPVPPEVDEAVVWPVETDVSSVYLTSGTTGGAPKGVARLHRRRMQRISGYRHQRDAAINFSPLAHSERDNNLLTFGGGGYVNLNLSKELLLCDIVATRPTDISSVPRLWHVLYEKFQHSLSLATRLSERLFAEQAVEVLAEELRPVVESLPEPAHSASKVRALSKAILSHSSARIEKAVRGAWRTALGGRCRRVHTGGAGISPDVLRWMKQTWGAVADGYGITEAGSVAVDGYISRLRDVRLRDVDGYTSDAKPYPQGEILVRGEGVATGYYNDPEASAERFQDGWFCTGDVGERLTDGRIRIIGRVKNTTKMLQGEWVNLDRLDDLYCSSDLAHQVFCHAQSDQPCVVAVVVGSDLLRASAEPAEPAVLDSFQRLARRKGTPEAHIPRAVHVTWEAFTPDNGLLTPSEKLCRPNLQRLFADTLAALFDRSTAGSVSSAIAGMLGDAAAAGADGELQLDSLAAVRLHTLVNEQFNVDLPLELLVSGAATIDDVASHVVRSRTDADVPLDELPPPPPDLRRRLDLDALEADADVAVPAELPPPPPPTGGHVFLTGATGFVGLSLLRELLDRSDRHVLCLVRGEDPRARLLGQLRWAFPAYEPDEARITVVPGDLAEPGLGLSAADRELVATASGLIVHCGALVNAVLDYAAHRRPNVLATGHIVELATTHSLKPIHYVSTLSVGVEAEHSPIHRDVQDVPSLGGYGQSKWVAELMLARARKAGVPVAVYRLGTVAGHTQSGYTNRTDFHGRLLLGLAQLRAYPTTGARLRMTPVDYVAGAIVLLALAPRQASTVVHVLAPNTLVPLARVVAGIEAAAGTRMQPLPLPDWVALLRRSPDCALAGLAHYFGNDRFPGAGRAPERTAFARAVASSGADLEAVRIDEEVLRRYVERLLSSAS